jgi:hypothetical protein
MEWRESCPRIGSFDTLIHPSASANPGGACLAGTLAGAQLAARASQTHRDPARLDTPRQIAGLTVPG